MKQPFPWRNYLATKRNRFQFPPDPSVRVGSWQALILLIGLLMRCAPVFCWMLQVSERLIC